MKYSDYGFEAGEERQLKTACRKTDFKTITLLVVAAFRANHELWLDLVYSLVKGLSYERLPEQPNINKVDFYAYRRKCLYNFKNTYKGSK